MGLARKLKLVFSIATLLVLAGCASFGPRVPPPSLNDIVQMSKSNVPPDVIIRKIRDSGAVYPLSAATFAKLHADGVDDSVLNYMQLTYLEQVRRDEANRNWSIHHGFWYGHHHHGHGAGFWFGF